MAQKKAVKRTCKQPTRTITSVSFDPALLSRLDKALDGQNRGKFDIKSRSCFIQELIDAGLKSHASAA